MIRLIAALASSRNGVDRAIALGEAVPRLERLKTMVVAGLVLVCAILAIGYANLSNQINTIETKQHNTSAKLAEDRQAAVGVRHEILALLQQIAGKVKASQQTQP